MVEGGRDRRCCAHKRNQKRRRAVSRMIPTRVHAVSAAPLTRLGSSVDKHQEPLINGSTGTTALSISLLLAAHAGPVAALTGWTYATLFGWRESYSQMVPRSKLYCGRWHKSQSDCVHCTEQNVSDILVSHRSFGEKQTTYR